MWGAGHEARHGVFSIVMERAQHHDDRVKLTAVSHVLMFSITFHNSLFLLLSASGVEVSCDLAILWGSEKTK